MKNELCKNLPFFSRRSDLYKMEEGETRKTKTHSVANKQK